MPETNPTDGVYLYGYYGQANLGDDLLMESATRMIRAVRPHAEIHVHCHDSEKVTTWDGIWPLRSVPANGILADQSIGKPKRMARYLAAVDGAFKRCDTLAFGGGTVFQDKGGAASILIIMATVLAAKRRGMHVVMLGSGVAPFKTAAGRFAMGRILAAADVACLRDEASLAICRAIRSTAELRLTGDLVFALEAPPPPPRRLDPPHVLLSLQPAVTERKTPEGERARAALRAVIGDALDRGGLCDLLALELKEPGGNGLDDAAAWRGVASGFLENAADRVRIRPLEAGLARVHDVIRGATVHVGMRYHGHVVAALAGIPFCGLAHDLKIREVCREFGMPCHDIGGVEPDVFVASAGQASEKAIPPEALIAHRARSLLNLDALRDVLAAP
jgi:polysaccharide pyruvyl transferase WcaK-like protein